MGPALARVPPVGNELSGAVSLDVVTDKAVCHAPPYLSG